MMDLHLDNYTAQEIEEIKANGTYLYLYATKEDCNNHNKMKLKEISSTTNPVAVLKTKMSTVASRTVMRNHLKCYDIPLSNPICRGATVCLHHKNFAPPWKLYNNAIGTVEEIVFKSGQNPNNGDLPAYVTVNFPSYTGPAWLSNNPKLVPIPMVSLKCQKKCCNIVFSPLALAFAKTGYSVQGLQAGPGCPLRTIFCDPGSRSFEGKSPGYLYMNYSRATTTGMSRTNSAIYFIGKNMNEHRVKNLFMSNRDKKYHRVLQREKWSEYLNKHEDETECTEEDYNNLMNYYQNLTIPLCELDEYLTKSSWRMRREEVFNSVSTQQAGTSLKIILFIITETTNTNIYIGCY